MQVNSPIDQCSKSLVGQDWDLQFVDYDHQQKWGSITYNPPNESSPGVWQPPFGNRSLAAVHFADFGWAAESKWPVEAAIPRFINFLMVPIPKE